MAILVTGGAGYIGSHTVIELLADNQDVVVVDDFSNAHPSVLNRIREISGKDFHFEKINILNREAMRDIFQTYDIEAVIHFAGFKAVGESVSKPLAYYENNLTGTIHLMQVMQEFEVKKMVFSSSATVYGDNNKAPFTENMSTSATNPYGKTKVFIEHFLMDQMVADSEWSFVILRYFNPIGAHESGRIGEDPNGIPNNLMPYISQVAVGKLEQLSIFGDDYDTPDGTGVRDYIHVVDLARGHLSALTYSLKHQGVEIFNLGTGEGYSVLDVVDAFEAANNINIPYQIVDRRPGDIAVSYANPDKAKNILDWEPVYDLKDMCQTAWNWQQNNPNGYAE